MTKDKQPPRRFSPLFWRMLCYLAVLLGIAAWRFLPHPWHPTLKIQTEHYVIESTAARRQVVEVGRALEALYTAYSNRFATLPTFEPTHPRLKVLLYKDRAEMRHVNPGLGWAEAFYRKPYCRAYYSAKEVRPCQWMLHEAVHQLNAEVAHLHPAKWLEEGLAEYFSTSRFKNGKLEVGRIDPSTYPVWWMDEMATGANIEASIQNGSIIPLREVITNHGGPNMSRHFNLYYLHWWTLTHFIFENEKYQSAAIKLVEQGGDLDSFEKLIGPVDEVQPEWYRYVCRIKSALNGRDLEFFKTGVLPQTESN